MMKDFFDSFFSPKTIAFIGASENSREFLSQYENFSEYGGDQDVFFVNPNRDTVLDRSCYDSIRDIPVQVDLAVILTPAAVVPTVFEECCEADVNSVNIVSAGFSEMGQAGRQRQEELARLSEKHDLPFCGPNSFGLISTYDELAVTQASELVEEGGVSLISQSGGLTNEIIPAGNERGFGFSKIIDIGNQAILSSVDVIEYLLEDDDTEVILGIIEGFLDHEKFMEVAKKSVEVGKPLIILKLARSEKGSELAQSHTASITTSDEITTAVFKQTGVVQAASLDQFLELTELFSKATRVSGNNVAVVEVSGGGSTLFSDAISESKLELAELTTDQRERIQKHIPDIGSTTNPIDLAVGWSGDSIEFAEILSILDESDDIDIVISRLTIPKQGTLSTVDQRLAEIQDVATDTDTLFTVVSRSSGCVSKEWINLIKETDIPFLQEYHKSVSALDRIVERSRYIDTLDESQMPVLDKKRLTPDGHVMDEYHAKQALSEQGFPIPKESLTTSKEEAVNVAESIGFPVCLKVVSSEIPHKTEVGGVKTGLTTPQEVKQGYKEIIDSVSTLVSKDAIDGILVQEMIQDGVELIVGSQQTPFGPSLMVGGGGIFTEILNDSTIRIAPFSSSTADEMLQELQYYDVLQGARSDDAVDIDSVATLVSEFSEFIAVNDQITEADLNPVIVTEDSIYVVDALFYFEED